MPVPLRQGERRLAGVVRDAGIGVVPQEEVDQLRGAVPRREGQRRPATIIARVDGGPTGQQQGD